MAQTILRIESSYKTYCELSHSSGSRKQVEVVGMRMERNVPSQQDGRNQFYNGYHESAPANFRATVTELFECRIQWCMINTGVFDVAVVFGHGGV